MTREPARALAVFARPVVPGAVKTRLAARIGAGPAARLYGAFLEDTLATAASLPGVRITLWVAGDPDHPTLSRFPHPRRRQAEVDLGERMARALAAGLREAPAAVVVGTDAPTLPRGHLRSAFALLEAAPGAPGDGRAVLGPAADGGYTLLGVRAPIPEGALDGIPWSTATVLGDTVARLRPSHGLPALLPPWYDVDDAEDLRLLRAHLAQSPPDVAPATRRALAGVRADG